MNIELARTFLEVLHHRSFSRAAEALHITQTAVTTRIQSLESQMGCRLLQRDRSGTSLTAQGESFVPYAKHMVQLWERARHEVPMTTQTRTNLQIGGELSLWNPLLLDWLLWLRGNLADTSVRAHVELAPALVSKVLQNVIDIAVLYSPQYHPQLQVEQLLEETLIMVRTIDDEHAGGEDYVNIDWGPEFSQHHDQTFPELMHSGLSIGLGPLALRYILKAGGSGYFRSRAVQSYIEAGRLLRVSNAPEFRYPVYITTKKDHGHSVIEAAMSGLRGVVDNEENSWML